MKTVQQIEKEIKNRKWFIEGHKKQLDFYHLDDFNADKISHYSKKILEIENEIKLLEWVLSDS